MSTLKLFNGRGGKGWRQTPYESLYIAAKSRADAARLLSEVFGRTVEFWQKEVKIYWSECWGNPMKEITPERGIWGSKEMFGPVERVK